MTEPLPQRQRVAAYAIILRDGMVLMSRLAPRLFPAETWTLPGGGIDFGEDPRDGVVREVYEETGLHATVTGPAWIDSARRPVAAMWDTGEAAELHSVRLIFEGWVAADAPAPRVVEENGSTADAQWVPLSEVLAGERSVVPWVVRALADHEPVRHQRITVRAVIRSGADLLVVRHGPSAVGPGRWTLPGGGVAHGEPPEQALVREVAEETGLAAEVGVILGVHHEHLTGTAPSGRHEDFHSIDLIYHAQVDPAGVPRVVEVGGTTDAVAWVPVAELRSGDRRVTGSVARALALLA